MGRHGKTKQANANLDEVFIEGVHASPKTAHLAHPLPCLDVDHIACTKSQTTQALFCHLDLSLRQFVNTQPMFLFVLIFSYTWITLKQPSQLTGH